MHIVKYIVKITLIIGAFELGIMGLFGYDVIGSLFGGVEKIGTKIIFDLIGLAGIVALLAICKCCCKGSCDTNKKDKGHGGGCCR